MTSGFSKGAQSLIQQEYTPANDVFNTVGMSTVKPLRFLEAVKVRGKIQSEEKTMIDALEPAGERLKEIFRKSANLIEGLKAE